MIYNFGGVREFSFSASIVLLIASYILPDHYFPWVAAYQEFSAALAVLFFLIFIFFSTERVYVSIFSLFFCVLAFISIFQFFEGVIYFFGDAVIVFAYLILFSLAVFAGYNFGREKKFYSRYIFAVFGVFIFSAVLSVWISLGQWFMCCGGFWVVDMRVGGRPFANFAQPNNFATFVCMAIGSVWYFYEKRILGRVTSAILILFLLFGVVLSQSRTPWVGCIAVALFWLWKAPRYPARLSVLALGIWLSIYIGLVVALPYIADYLHISAANLLDRASALHRWPLWVQLWNAVLDGPVWGYGWNQISVAQVAMSTDYPVPLMVEHSHNILLDLLIWNGPILGGLIIFTIAVWLVGLGVRANSAESIFSLIIVGFVLVHGMLEFPLDYAFFLFPVGLLLGAVEGEQRSAREWSVSRGLIGAVLLAGVGMFAWIWQEYRVIEEDHRLMRFETARIGDLKAEQAAPDVVLLTQLREFIRFARTPATEGMSHERLDWMRKIAHRYPYPPSLFRYSLALALNGQITESVEQLEILRALHGDRHLDESLQALIQMQVKYPQIKEVLMLLEYELNL